MISIQAAPGAHKSQIMRRKANWEGKKGEEKEGSLREGRRQNEKGKGKENENNRIKERKGKRKEGKGKPCMKKRLEFHVG